MLVNGVETTLEKECVLLDFLIRENYQTGRVAVEKNGKIVPKAQFENETLTNADRLEIVAFVGGG